MENIYINKSISFNGSTLKITFIQKINSKSRDGLVIVIEIEMRNRNRSGALMKLANLQHSKRNIVLHNRKVR